MKRSAPFFSFLLATVLLPFAPAARAELQWNGNLITRYRIFNYDDSLGSVNAAQNDISRQKLRAWDLRGNVLARATSDNGWEGLFGIRTWNVIVNDFLPFNNGNDLTVRIDQAFARKTYKFDGGDYGFALGRQATVVLTDKLAQHLYDNDVRWDGLSFSGKYGIFGVVGGAFVTGAINQGVAGSSEYTYTEASQAAAGTQGRMSAHYAIQPNVTIKVSDDIETMIAAGYYAWNSTSGVANTIHGGYNSSTLNPNADTGTVNVDNSRVWHLYNTWKFPYSLRASIEFVQNKKFFYTVGGEAADRSASQLGLGYGGVKDVGDFAVDYFYVNKGLASMPGNLTNGGIKPDNKGHLAYLRYQATKGVILGLVYYNLEEKAQKTAVGAVSRVKQKQQQWYFTAGTSF
jgi:hypothetical protein